MVVAKEWREERRYKEDGYQVGRLAWILGKMLAKMCLSPTIFAFFTLVRPLVYENFNVDEPTTTRGQVQSRFLCGN
ncbi:mucin-12-like isoform X2 [Vespula maculifrons]|uniref:Mucin-12-like isoform X2 n=1 Tax=Vespula maculifrons TaxID=7453 RepID=A0ABD2CYK6_VESMC